ncbi:hypothetical protein BT69DRAFT_591705 [Atractiella rhizophila]|nr:hypothetical protein BT69DRAFT_591705 [Atractiella rhizophila]
MLAASLHRHGQSIITLHMSINILLGIIIQLNYLNSKSFFQAELPFPCLASDNALLALIVGTIFRNALFRSFSIGKVIFSLSVGNALIASLCGRSLSRKDETSGDASSIVRVGKSLVFTLNVPLLGARVFRLVATFRFGRSPMGDERGWSSSGAEREREAEGECDEYVEPSRVLTVKRFAGVDCALALESRAGGLMSVTLFLPLRPISSTSSLLASPSSSPPGNVSSGVGEGARKSESLGVLIRSDAGTSSSAATVAPLNFDLPNPSSGYFPFLGSIADSGPWTGVSERTHPLPLTRPAPPSGAALSGAPSLEEIRVLDVKLSVEGKSAGGMVPKLANLELADVGVSKGVSTNAAPPALVAAWSECERECPNGIDSESLGCSFDSVR